MIPYEILIRGKNGILSGSHAIDNPGDNARPLTPADLASVAPLINAAALARVTELEGIAAERDKLADDIAAALDDNKLDHVGVVNAIDALVTAAKKPAKDKQVAELQRQRAELDKQIDTLTKPPKPAK